MKTNNKSEEQPYDIVKIPFDFLPDRLIAIIPLTENLLFETFSTTDLSNEYETYYIDVKGRLFLEQVSHCVLVGENDKVKIDRSAIMRHVKEHKLSKVYATFSGKTYTLELLFQDAVLFRINLKGSQ